MISTQPCTHSLAEIKVTDGLKLPHRASTVIPDEVRALQPSQKNTGKFRYENLFQQHYYREEFFAGGRKT